MTIPTRQLWRNSLLMTWVLFFIKLTKIAGPFQTTFAITFSPFTNTCYRVGIISITLLTHVSEFLLQFQVDVETLARRRAIVKEEVKDEPSDVNKVPEGEEEQERDYCFCGWEFSSFHISIDSLNPSFRCTDKAHWDRERTTNRYALSLPLSSFSY